MAQSSLMRAHIFFRVTWERVHREKKNSSPTELGIIASSLAMFYFQLSHTRYVVRWISRNSLSSSHCLRFTFVCAMVIMNFYNFLSLLLFIFFVSLFGSICTLGLSFPEIFAIWFLCVAFVPTKEKKKWTSTQKGATTMMVSGPATPQRPCALGGN